MTGFTCAREQASESGVGTTDRIVVGSVQTLMRESRLARYQPWDFTHVFIDEAHHSVADSYTRILDRFSDAKVLGVTATPDRADKKGLARVFDSLAYEYGIKQAINEHYLCPIKAMMIPLDIDLTNVSVKAGDYDAHQLGDAIEPYLDAIADEMADRCRDRNTVVFLPLVQMAKDFAEMLNERGLSAREVDGNSDDRDDAIHSFARGEFSVIVNSMLLTEGWDDPAVDCVVVLRPTKSRALYAQMVGRGTRLSPETGKKDVLILDFLWMTERHNLCRPASLLGASDEVTARVEDKVREGGYVDILDAEGEAISDIRKEREDALAQMFRQNRHRKAAMVDPMEFVYAIGDIDLQDYEPTFHWETLPVTEKQYAYLKKNNIDATAMTKGMASKLISALVDRQRTGKATARQLMQLERNGFMRASDWTFEQASAVMSMLAGNGWSVPNGIDPSTYIPS